MKVNELLAEGKTLQWKPYGLDDNWDDSQPHWYAIYQGFFGEEYCFLEYDEDRKKLIVLSAVDKKKGESIVKGRSQVSASWKNPNYSFKSYKNVRDIEHAKHIGQKVAEE